jgi:hypothetical protein
LSGWFAQTTLALLLAGGITGCGGSGSDGGDARARPILTALQATPVMYGEPMRITIEGDGLDASIVIAVSGACRGEAALSFVSNSRLEAACTPDDLGPLMIEVRSADGDVLATETREILRPRVEIALGPESSPASFTFELDPGDKTSGTRPWVDLFLHRLRASEYDDTVFHDIRGGVLVQGGCYRMDDAGIPRPSTLSAPPPGLSPLLVAPNTKDTLAMSSELCGPNPATAQPGVFAFNFANNTSGSLTDQDSDRFVVIGRLQAGDTAAWSALANQQARTPPPVGWPERFPVDPQALKVRRIQRSR